MKSFEGILTVAALWLVAAVVVFIFNEIKLRKGQDI